MHNSPTVKSRYSNNLISPIQHLKLLPGAIDKHGLLLWIDQLTHLGAIAQTIISIVQSGTTGKVLATSP